MGTEADFFWAKLELFLLNGRKELNGETLEEFRVELSRSSQRSKSNATAYPEIEQPRAAFHSRSDSVRSVTTVSNASEDSNIRETHLINCDVEYLGFDFVGPRLARVEPTATLPDSLNGFDVQHLLPGEDTKPIKQDGPPDCENSRQKLACPRFRMETSYFGTGLAPWPQTYMFDCVERRAQVIRERIHEVSDALRRVVSSVPLGRANDLSPEEFLVVGRVRMIDSKATNSHDAFIEDEEGRSVRLDLSLVPKFFLYPGKIIGIVGRNPTGRVLEVDRILDNICAASPVAQRGKRSLFLNPKSYSPKWRGLFAAGPFANIQDPSLKSLERFEKEIQKLEPDFVCLIGPIIEEPMAEANENIPHGSRLAQGEELLASIRCIAERMPRTRFLLCPSLDDAMHPLPVFPQRPYDFKTDPALKLGNPAQFRVILENGDFIDITVMSSPIVEKLQQACIHKGCASSLLSECAAEIIKQGSFFPLWPSVQETAVDYGLSSSTQAQCPDILVLSGSAGTLVTEANGCCVVCPEKNSYGQKRC
ncbi:hypothetical protein F1559_000892 [Cyanidiococcus yangmingshanensis]|uniref:DNA polymerase alpha subunit B n=1 Tax=Cyanidiococcus yangmingshanensis TaxID=2690220 RepID=A0A7J7IJK2_9RHOD|nr:hypothetical protein F1559_000892 [Cyanidiococcus yangmingshanensis]